MEYGVLHNRHTAMHTTHMICEEVKIMLSPVAPTLTNEMKVAAFSLLMIAFGYRHRKMN